MVQEGRPLGVVRRDHLFDLLAKPLHPEIYNKKPVTAVMESPTLLIDSQLRLEQVSRLVTQKGEHRHRLDIKKGGIFPIVHAARALALEQGIDENGTLARVRRLTEIGLFDRQLGANVADAFSALLDLRLQARLERMRLHQPLDDLVDPGDLSKLERDVLKESLLIAKKVKDIVRNHFQLGLF